MRACSRHHAERVRCCRMFGSAKKGLRLEFSLFSIGLKAQAGMGCKNESAGPKYEETVEAGSARCSLFAA
ncbi:hypothetical protein BaRGS_00030197 [Batillaria attramentaria]|uniref:Uncharacterized protein n=1 Tax=Batillaria attramentaria TaxID=370345 RepID=A0ABD0JV24_9CAEN